MIVSRNMPLSDLAERMGSQATEEEARKMRDLLIRGRYEGRNTREIPEPEWIPMVEQAQRSMATIKETYDILSTFDIPRINAALGTQFENLGQVHRAQAETFACLTDGEKEADLQEIEQDLARHDATRTDIN